MGLGLYIFDRIKTTRKPKYKKIFKMLAVLIIISSLIISSVFTIFMINLWRRPIAPADDTAWMSEETYDTGMYLNEFGNNSNFVLNDWIIWGRIIAISKKSIYLRLNLSRVSIQRGSFLDLYYSDTLYVITSKEYGSDINIHSLNFEKDAQRITIALTQNDIKFALEKNNIPKGQFMAGGGVLRSSAFYSSMFGERYKIYDNGDISVWNID
ncbi:MAG: hypothetical protein KAJ51_13670 [Thermoplasmata archaeon]|nr:hypothetical protein [Thermoplasmata archaeon]